MVDNYSWLEVNLTVSTDTKIRILLLVLTKAVDSQFDISFPTNWRKKFAYESTTVKGTEKQILPGVSVANHSRRKTHIHWFGIY